MSGWANICCYVWVWFILIFQEHSDQPSRSVIPQAIRALSTLNISVSRRMSLTLTKMSPFIAFQLKCSLINIFCLHIMVIHLALYYSQVKYDTLRDTRSEHYQLTFSLPAQFSSSQLQFFSHIFIVFITRQEVARCEFCWNLQVWNRYNQNTNLLKLSSLWVRPGVAKFKSSKYGEDYYSRAYIGFVPRSGEM